MWSKNLVETRRAHIIELKNELEEEIKKGERSSSNIGGQDRDDQENRIKSLRKSLDSCYKAENTYWKQRAKVKCLKDDDKNTRPSESSVLLNGEQGKWIRHRKGLRQGDPLSPYLFLLIADVFVRMMKSAAQQNLIQGVRMNEEMNISSLEFADDFMVFTRGDDDDLLNLKILLFGYELMTGLRQISQKQRLFTFLETRLGVKKRREYWDAKGRLFL
ncbi:mitochondrial protein [Canna indica]|uniref:Mitochondrial protein n=1 Tax=Canna indica TaxID=4628 RepID=A0AAQ3K9Y8_9LILI|nr:mitochondrial protein [Canna indica]